MRDGRESDTQSVLQTLLDEGVPREAYGKVVALCRRANLPLLGLKLLHPLVRPSGKSATSATDQERAEYAACLAYLGAVEEAMTILRALDPVQLPKVRLYLVLALFGQWDYAAAIPHLIEHLKVTTDPYARLVAMTNLADALVNEQEYRKATDVFRELLYAAGLRKYPLVHGRAILLSAQHLTETGRWSDAEKALTAANAIFGDRQGIQGFLVRKAATVLNYLKEKGQGTSLQALEAARQESATMGYWEGVRDCDRVQALVTHDRNLFIKLYAGTPYLGFRRRLAKEFGEEPAIDEEYLWVLAGTSPPILDLERGKTAASEVKLKVGQVVHRLLSCLASDFYRPFRLAVLHHHLHPDEFFNPLSSPGRVRETLKRLRSWFEQAGLPLEITQSESEYRLQATGPCAIRVRVGSESGRQGLLMERLREKWPDGGFSAKEAGDLLGVSTRTAQRLLQEEVREDRLERQGRGGAITYRFSGRRAA